MRSRANSSPEFSRIAQYFAPLTAGEAGAFALANDAAALHVPAGKQIVLTSDSCIEGWHVPRGASPQQIAQKLTRRNLSDLAAMGAAPWRYMINLHLPHATSDDYVAAFAAALKAEQETFGMVLIGGDSTFGGDHAHVSMTLMGLAETTHNRSGARVGDDVYVSGIIGEGARALQLIEGAITVSDAERATLLARYYTPTPRLALGKALIGIATSVIDISDGLVNDLTHLARGSDTSIELHVGDVPLTAHDLHMRDMLLNGGDDYELAFTAPADAAVMLQHIAEHTGTPITHIGTVIPAREEAISLR